MSKKTIPFIIKEDVIYDALSEIEQLEIREEAIEELKKTNPDFENPRVSFMKKTLIRVKIRELVHRKYCGNRANLKALRQEMSIKKMRQELHHAGGGKDAA